jgi:hypothetical protein
MDSLRAALGGPGVVGLEADQFLDAGDHIVVTGRFTGRDSEGRTLDAPCAHVWRFSNGAATRFANYTDWTVWSAPSVAHAPFGSHPDQT